MIDDLGTLHASSPLAAVHGERVTFLVDGEPRELAVLVRPHGTCAFQHAQVLARMGEVVPYVAFGAGYWETVFEAGGHLHGCLELREGYVSVVVAPSPGPPRLDDVLAEASPRPPRRPRRAPHHRRRSADPAADPAAGRRPPAAPGRGRWWPASASACPAATCCCRSCRSAADSTLYAIGVDEGRCAPGTAAAPSEVAAALFPPRLGAVWVDLGAIGPGGGPRSVSAPTPPSP